MAFIVASALRDCRNRQDEQFEHFPPDPFGDGDLIGAEAEESR
jgi:hypothetical protein